MIGDTSATLREFIEGGLDRYGESPEDVEQIVIASPDERGRGPVETQFSELTSLDEHEGDTSFGGEELPDFYVWTEQRTYWKGVYDGSEYIKSVPRSPTLENPDLSQTPASDDS